MAASRDTVHEEDSSSEDEDQEKLREAAWSFGPTGANGTHHSSSAGGDKNDKPSRRVKVSQHDYDGNELQTTPEFRAHVAKKLGALLDSCISESTPDTSTPPPRSGKAEDEDEDEGFRLFSTSVPGLCVKEPSPPLPRRPVPSSSDSDSEMEMRLREAAISVTDLLPPASLPSMPQTLSSPAPLSPEKKKKKKKKKKKESGEEGEKENGACDSTPKKKKKRKLMEGGSQEGEDERNSRDSRQSKNETEEQGTTEEESFPLVDSECQLEQEETHVKKKKKKKKKVEREGEG